MGFSPGDFTDLKGVQRHIEQKDHGIRFYWGPGEMGQSFDLAPDQARLLADQLILAAQLMDGRGFD